MKQRAIAAVFSALCAVVLVACGGSSDSGPLARHTPTPPSAVAVGTTPAPPAGSPAAAAPTPSALPQIKLERAFPNQGFRQTTGMYEMPGAPGRFLLLEQQGRIMTFDAAGADKPAAVFMDLRSRVNANGSELGLLGLAFAPDFATSRAFYLDYTAANPLRTVVARFTANAAGTTADPASAQVILEQPQPFENHNGGQIVFGPDGFLYIAFGDGGSARDPQGNGQNRNVLLGKLLRIDVSGTSTGRAYRVPPDNPFAGQANVRDEIWAYGLRNPWRFSFDRETGDLWSGDVGQNAREEVDVIKKGGNYGWNVMEGTICLSGNSCDKSGKTLPVIDYPTTSENCAITGGFVYRGQAIAALRGAYVYGDYCSGKVWALRYDGTKVTQESQIAALGMPMSSFAQDASGELYAVAYGQNAGVYKLAP